jgi:hypothetical protein
MMKWLAVWVAWLVVGALAFDLPQLLVKKGAVVTAFEAASPQCKTYVGFWLLGSVVLFALLLRAVVQRSAKPPTSPDGPAAASPRRGRG